MSIDNALPGFPMSSPPRRERLQSTMAHRCKIGDFIAKSTDWRPYVVVGATLTSLEIERMKIHRAIATRIAMKVRRDRWSFLNGIGRTIDA